MSFLVREVLERTDDVPSARKLLRDARRTCEYYYVVSDGNARDAIGVMATPKRLHVVRPGEAFALVDLPPLPPGDSTTRRVAAGKLEERRWTRRLKGPHGEVVLFTPPEDTVVISGRSRFEHFCERLEKGYGKVDEKALMEMVKRPVSMRGNLHVAIFHPSTGRAWIAVAAADGAPACDQRYVEVRLPRRGGDGGEVVPAPLLSEELPEQVRVRIGAEGLLAGHDVEGRSGLPDLRVEHGHDAARGVHPEAGPGFEAKLSDDPSSSRRSSIRLRRSSTSSSERSLPSRSASTSRTREPSNSRSRRSISDDLSTALSSIAGRSTCARPSTSCSRYPFFSRFRSVVRTVV
jgi:hypothetical protein